MRLIDRHDCRRIVRASLAATTLAAVTLPTMARAEDDPVGTVLQTANVVATQSCTGIETLVPEPNAPDIDFGGTKWRVVPTKRVAYFVASHSGEMVAPGEALDFLRPFDRRAASERPIGHDALRALVYHIQGILVARELNGLRAFDKANKPVSYSDTEHNQAWITRPDVVLRCKLPQPSTARQVADGTSNGAIKKDENGKIGIDLRLAGSVEALGAEGEVRNSAAAATVGYNRTRTFQEDGSRTETNELTVKAMLGAAFETGNNSDLMIYGGYELKRNRAKPAAPLVPPATARDGDTEIVTIGAGFGKLVPLAGKANPYAFSVNLRFDGAYKFDLVKEAERAEGKLTATLYSLPKTFGICGLGGFTDFGNGFYTRCDLIGEFSYSKVTKRGLLVPTGKDYYAHAGGKAAFAVFYGDPSENAAFLNAEYTYLPRISGDPNTIKTIRQHKVSLGYRWWTGTAYALEVKGELTDGINPDSYADENALTLGFGIIF